MPEPKKHNLLLEIPRPLAKEYKKMVKERGMYLGSFTVVLMEKAIKDWKAEKEKI
ncbi:MAG: hypothetical protein Q8K02_08125 [Flavobacterium sp.]|nr:hypothetical protein [Flavobacterium sp.]